MKQPDAGLGLPKRITPVSLSICINQCKSAQLRAGMDVNVDDLNEMIVVLKQHKEDALKVNDFTKALKIQTEMDEIEKQIAEEEKYFREKTHSQTSCVKCGTAFEAKKKMVGILKTKEMVCDDCRVVPMPDV